MPSRRTALKWGCAAALLSDRLVWAKYPERSIRLIIPFAAGGNGDVMARLTAPYLATTLGQQVVTENLGGAGGGLGAELVARAKPDGYTLLWGANGPLVNSPLMNKAPRYDARRDFAAVGLMSLVPMVLVMRADLPLKSVKEFVALSKSRPNGLAIGTSGIGGANHVPLELLKAATQANIVHVPYKGGGSALPDLLGGNVDGLFTEVSTVLAFHREGRVRIVSIAADKRLPLIADVPTFIEQGLADFTAYTFNGLWAPAGTPEPVIGQLQEGLAAALRVPAVLEQVAVRGALPASAGQQTPASATAFLQNEIARTQKAMKLANIQPE